MLTYKQRYKPRTEREYTKADLTVYDSAGNTALRGLKVYGKSEVVDGAIKSAGEGYAIVDLGTLDWTYSQNYPTPMFSTDAVALGCKKFSDKFVCGLYQPELNAWYTQNNDMKIASGASSLNITNLNYTDVAAFKSAMSGIILAYEEATPTNNTIAVKTDDGSGIDGTMAVFETGTPLRGIPDTTVRDVMVWNGSAGTVTKNCADLDLGLLTWTFNDTLQCFQSHGDLQFKISPESICSKYTYRSFIDAANLNDKEYTLGVNGRIYIKDTDYTDATAFKASLSGVRLVYELATPTTEALTQAENESIASLRTFNEPTHFTNNASTDMTVNYTIKVPTIS